MNFEMAESRQDPISDTQTSDRFSAPDADLVFRSSDGVVFRIHSRFLENTTESFPKPKDFPANGREIVDLPEKSSTLELMFQFVYPRLQPSIENIDFETLAPLAEAVEKYQVYPALRLCNIMMKNTLPNHALEVLEYAVRHNHTALIDQAGPLVTLETMSNATATISPEILQAWVRFHRNWNKALCTMINCGWYSHTRTDNGCRWESSGSDGWKAKILYSLWGPGGIADVDSNISALQLISVEPQAPYCCRMGAETWQANARATMENVPAFSTVL